MARWAREAYPEVEAAFARARDAVESELKRVEEALAAIDPTLRGAADAARGRALHPIGALHEKSLRALKKRDQARADRLRRTRDALFPGGAFQERGLSFVGLLARHGVPLLADARSPSRSLGARPPGHPAMRIGITCYPTIGGSGAVAAELGKQLARRGPRHPLHLLPPSLPPRGLPGEHLLPRGGRLHLRALRVPALRPGPGREDGRSGPRASPRPLPRALRRSPTPSRASSPRRCWAAIPPSW